MPPKLYSAEMTPTPPRASSSSIKQALMPNGSGNDSNGYGSQVDPADIVDIESQVASKEVKSESCITALTTRVREFSVPKRWDTNFNAFWEFWGGIGLALAIAELIDNIVKPEPNELLLGKYSEWGSYIGLIFGLYTGVCAAYGHYIINRNNEKTMPVPENVNISELPISFWQRAGKYGYQGGHVAESAMSSLIGLAIAFAAVLPDNVQTAMIVIGLIGAGFASRSDKNTYDEAVRLYNYHQARP